MLQTVYNNENIWLLYSNVSLILAQYIEQCISALFWAVCFSSLLLLTTLTYTLNPMIWTILHLRLLHAPEEQEDKHCQVESKQRGISSTRIINIRCHQLAAFYCFLLLINCEMETVAITLQHVYGYVCRIYSCRVKTRLNIFISVFNTYSGQI